MNFKYFVTLLAVPLSLYAHGQNKNSTQINNSALTINNPKKMDPSKITNEKVKLVIEALQAGDRKTWFSYFIQDPTFTDDGRTLNFKSFFDNAFDKKEKFLTIDKVENNGKDIYGNFYAGQWGTFRVFFKFHQNSDGKFVRLDIGQANN